MNYLFLYLLLPPLLAVAGFSTYACWKIGRKPDLVIFNKINGVKVPYVSRWYLAMNKLYAVFIHEFTNKDLDLPHNHIGPMVSLVIAGRGREEFFNVLGAKTGERELKPGRIYFRGTKYPHLIHSSEDAPLQTIVFAWIGAEKNWGFFNTDGTFYPAKEYCRSSNFNKSSYPPPPYLASKGNKVNGSCFYHPDLGCHLRRCPGRDLWFE